MEGEEDKSSKEILEFMVELMNHTKFPVAGLLKRLGLKETDVLNIYVVGSRLWGTASYSSDWDFLIVHKNWKKVRSSVHNGNADASIIDKNEFRKRILTDHKFFEISTLWIPEHCIWKENFVLRKEFIKEMNPTTLLQSVVEETTRDWRVSEKMWNKGKYYKSKKIIVHAITMVLISKQLVLNGEIKPNDYTVGYKYHQLLQNDTESSWSYYNTTYYTIFSDHMKCLKEICCLQKKKGKKG